MANVKNKETMAYKNKMFYIREYNKKGVKISLQLNRKTDMDIIEWLEDKSKATTLKKLIREEMKREKEGK